MPLLFLDQQAYREGAAPSDGEQGSRQAFYITFIASRGAGAGESRVGGLEIHELDVTS